MYQSPPLPTLVPPPKRLSIAAPSIWIPAREERKGKSNVSVLQPLAFSQRLGRASFCKQNSSQVFYPFFFPPALQGQVLFCNHLHLPSCPEPVVTVQPCDQNEICCKSRALSTSSGFEFYCGTRKAERWASNSGLCFDSQIIDHPWES